MKKRLPVSCALVLLASASPLTPAALAQDANPPGILRAPVVDGWPDVSAAMDSVATSPAAVRVIDDLGVSLDDRRAILRDAAVRSAMDSMHQALNSPKMANPIFGSGARLDRLFRLRDTVEYVAFAAGKIGEGIDDFADALSLADELEESGSNWDYNFTVNIQTFLIRGMASHLEQLSEGDCAILITCLRRELAQPDPYLLCIEARHNRSAKSTTFSAADAADIRRYPVDDPITSTYKYQLSADDLNQIASLIAMEPAIATKISEHLSRKESEYYDKLRAEYVNYPAVSSDTSAEITADSFTGHELTDRFAARTLEVARDAPSPHVVSLLTRLGATPPKSDRAATEARVGVRTLTQMLLVAAEIRRYRWQHGKPPASLDDLKIGKNAIDKFSGKPFVYERQAGQKYTLASVGPADPNSSASSTAHQPLTFADERKPLVP